MAAEQLAAGAFKVAVKGGGMTMDKEVDQATALAVVNLLMGGDVVPPDSDGATGGRGDGAEGKRGPARRASSKGGRRTKSRGKASKGKSVGLDKNLSMRPKGKKSFPDFVAEKQPSTQHDKNAVCVFWLSKEIGYSATPEAVNKCYQGAEWKRPSDLRNSLRVTASTKGWIDTSDADDIKITTSGEDYVEHDLPKPAKK